ncbi:MAG: helix-turn-helix transcriptional regulator [Deltaproteobacteria bacterium]|nr:helix-turn-helix transcriptional regulator [Deltaproteobacteria bacterium]
MKNKRKLISLKEVLKNEMKDPEFAFYFEREKAIGDISRLVRQGRLKAALTQDELAQKAKTTQTVIARLESGMDKRTPSLDLLQRIAHALKAKLMVSFKFQNADERAIIRAHKALAGSVKMNLVEIASA